MTKTVGGSTRLGAGRNSRCLRDQSEDGSAGVEEAAKAYAGVLEVNLFPGMGGAGAIGRLGKNRIDRSTA